MQVSLAKKAGACYGVNRSIEMVERAISSGKRIATLGELIHNPQTVKELEDAGVVVVSSVDEAVAKDIDVLVIRSHGVAKSVLNYASSQGFEIVDATCPHVKKAQQTAATLAKKHANVLVVGKEGHPEVIGICSRVLDNNSNCCVVQSILDVKKFLNEEYDTNFQILNSKKACKSKNTKDGNIGVLVQTTQSVERFEGIVDYLTEKSQQNVQIEAINTICNSTSARQSSAEELSKEVDAFVVVGGKNSSNTTHLAEVCKKNCNKVFHIEYKDELNKADFKGCKKVGLTAGASTPQSQIETVLNFLQKLG